MRALGNLIVFLITLPILAVSVSFAISNTESVTLRLWPLSYEAGLPVALLVFVVLVLGFLLGALTAFIGAGKIRSRARTAESKLRQAERDLARVKRENADASGGTTQAALPAKSGEPPLLAAE